MSKVKEIYDNELQNFIVTALEGGINYWAFIDDHDLRVINTYSDVRNEPLSIRFHHALINGESLGVLDRHDMEGGIVGRITYESGLKAFKDLAHEQPKMYARMVEGAYDAGDIDYWFQLASIGKYTFA